jgi:hypothetical protein
MLHNGLVEAPPSTGERPVVSIPCVGDKLTGWVVVDGIDSRYRVATHPASLPHGEQFLSDSEPGSGVNTGSPRLSGLPWYGIALLRAYYDVSVSSPLLNMAGER